MPQRIKISTQTEVAERLNQLGCTPEQVQRHITALSRPKPKTHYRHPIEIEDDGNTRAVGWTKLVRG